MAAHDAPNLVVGLTGGIGSGKSAAADIFADRGVEIVDADIMARVVVEPGRKALQQIAGHFGNNILQADGALDRAALRAVVFAQPREKQWLETLLHPLIRAEIVQALHGARSPYVILVSPLLLETDQKALTDRILVIDVPERLQIERTVRRDDTTAEDVTAIMATQWTREQRLAMADDVIVNDRDLQHLRDEVMVLHDRYCLMAFSGLRAMKSEAAMSQRELKVNCPTCNEIVIWSEASPYRPFCSKRCKLIDFGEWASERHAIPGASVNPDPDKDDEDA